MFRRSLATLVTAFLLITAGNLTAAAAENPSKAEARQKAAASMLTDIKQATWIRDGKSVHVIYVFFDPNCPYCHKVYEMLRPQVQRGKVELRWVVTGRLMATSIGKAAAMLEAKDPTEAFYRNERGFSQETGNFGGIEEEPAPREETLRRLNANLALLNRSGFDAVPALLFRTKDGKADIIRGAPPAVFLEKLVKDLE
ncbi:MAG: thiol:disulfide interchange protein DsbG [Pseudomonadota bacterium]